MCMRDCGARTFCEHEHVVTPIRFVGARAEGGFSSDAGLNSRLDTLVAQACAQLDLLASSDPLLPSDDSSSPHSPDARARKAGVGEGEGARRKRAERAERERMKQRSADLEGWERFGAHAGSGRESGPRGEGLAGPVHALHAGAGAGAGSGPRWVDLREGASWLRADGFSP